MSTSPTMDVSTRHETFANGLTLRIDERGHGRPLLVLHGASGPRSVAKFAEALAANAHVLVATHPGFGGEPRPDWFATVDDLATAYGELLARLDLRNVIVIGFSFGGWVAAELTVRAQVRLAGLVLVDAAGIEVEGYPLPNMFGRPPALGAGGQPAGPPRVDPGTLSPEEAAQRAASRQAMAVYARDGLANPALRDQLTSVTIPALVIWGENDPIMAVPYGRAYAQAFPHGQFEVIADAGHFPEQDQPERLVTAVRAFMNSMPLLPSINTIR